MHIRRHLAATPLFQGLYNFRPTRIAMLRAETRAELEAILDNVEQNWLGKNPEELRDMCRDEGGTAVNADM